MRDNLDKVIRIFRNTATHLDEYLNNSVRDLIISNKNQCKVITIASKSGILFKIFELERMIMQAATAIPLQQIYSASKNKIQNICSDCNRAQKCLAYELEGGELDAFNQIVTHSKKLNRGDYLYQAGDEFSSIFVIRSGSIKTFIDDEDGREQILGFSIQGDIAALDGATMNEYPTTAQALETTYVCEIPFARYLELAVKEPTLYKQLLIQMSNQIRNEEEHTLLIGTKSAEQRLASLLISFSKRYAERGFSKNEFNLHMSRRDIGNYLSAAMETVNRLFSRLQASELIEIHGKLVKIRDYDGLHRLATGSDL